MTPQKSIQPMELVISAIHCLKDRKGSSPREIVKYLEKKYDVCGESLKTKVETGLKRAVSFGLIKQKAGLYYLNEILRSPLKKTKSNKIQKAKIPKGNAGLKKRKFYKLAKKIKKTLNNRKKRVQNSKTRRKLKQKKVIRGPNSKRQADLRRRKCRRQKSKSNRTQKLEKSKKLAAENKLENNLLNPTGSDKNNSCD